jgi:hypothetical protein
MLPTESVLEAGARMACPAAGHSGGITSHWHAYGVDHPLDERVPRRRLQLAACCLEWEHEEHPDDDLEPTAAMESGACYSHGTPEQAW